MERCDFSSISTCLKNQISESNQMNQPDFLYELFEDFMNDRKRPIRGCIEISGCCM